MSLGKTLRKLRLNKRLSQKELANMLNISGVTISNYERDARTPSMDTLKHMANIFNVTIDYLVSFAPENELNQNKIHDIGLEIDNILEELSSSTDITFYDKPLTKSDKENLKMALQIAIELSQIKTK